jgi:citrate lyase subunit beta/citryl-CoA lyase
VPIANEVFSPTAEEIAWAEKVVVAFTLPENANKAVIAVEGQMVERLHLLLAARVLETATAILPPET